MEFGAQQCAPLCFYGDISHDADKASQVSLFETTLLVTSYGAKSATLG
jgi:hypothetical protein